jgi:hypothetical protein
LQQQRRLRCRTGHGQGGVVIVDASDPVEPALRFARAYFILSGLAGIPPARGTIGEVVWATWLVDYHLGHRWGADEVPSGAPLFMPRKGYAAIRVYHLNPALVSWALRLSGDTLLRDSDAAKAYRDHYPQDAARRPPSVATDTHMTGDTFFLGPGMSAQAQYIAKPYGADDHVITEMEGTAITQVITRQFGTDRVMARRGELRSGQSIRNHLEASRSGPRPVRPRLRRDGGQHRVGWLADGGSYPRGLAAMGRRRAPLCPHRNA